MNQPLTIPALAGFLAGLLANLLPRVDVLPDEVGLGIVFAIAGAGGCLGFLADYARGVKDQKWVRRGTAWGFGLGVLFLLSVAVVRGIVL